jgi:NADH-quinone oxidoreductase subunit L
MNHLSIMMLALGLGAIGAALFHVFVHSIFKALLFFSAGIAIHVTGTQDLRRMRLCFGKSMFALTTLIGALTLAGLAPLAGFVSKEGVFSAIASTGSWEIVALFSLGIFLSAAYIVRWLLLIFHPHGKFVHAPWQMSLPLPILALLCLIGGLAAAPVAALLGLEAAHALPLLSISATLLTLAGAIAALLVMRRKMIQSLPRSVLAEVFRQRALIDELGEWIASRIARFAGIIAWTENEIINRSVRHFTQAFSLAGSCLRTMHTGQPRAYIAAILLGFVLIAIALGVLA